MWTLLHTNGLWLSHTFVINGIFGRRIEKIFWGYLRHKFVYILWFEPNKRPKCCHRSRNSGDRWTRWHTRSYSVLHHCQTLEKYFLRIHSAGHVSAFDFLAFVSFFFPSRVSLRNTRKRNDYPVTTFFVKSESLLTVWGIKSNNRRAVI